MKSLLLFSFLTFCFVGYGQIIDFPDIYFKDALVNTKCINSNDSDARDADLNDDGEIDLEEALQVTNLKLSNSNISSLEGIENFKMLRVLNCESNNLASLDVDELLNLERLHCRFNQITSLDLIKLVNLLDLRIGGNQLIDLNLEGMIKLDFLDCNGNNLTSINLQGCTNLRFAFLSKNKLETLNIQGLLSLTYFNCSNNLLKTLYMKKTKVSNLNFEESPLEYICCDEEKISKIKNMAIENGQNCEVNSECTVTNTNNFFTEVSISPNPVTDILYLDTKDNWTKAEIYNISGRIMRSKSLDGQSIDVSGLESGTYFIRLKDGDSVGLVKFVKM